jgi:hypothetical protein
MSQAQKAQARAAKAEAQLLAAVRSGEEPRSTPATAGLPPEVQAWLQAVRDAEVDRVYQSDARFASYGFTQGDLVGETPEEIRASADRFKKLIERVEGRVRNEIRREFGLTPDIGGDRRGPRVDFGNLSTEDFLKELDRRKAGF